jgi:hypothetical protein
LATSTFSSVTSSASPWRPKLPSAATALIAVDQGEIADRDRLGAVLDRGARAGRHLPGLPLSLEPKRLQVYLLMIRVQRQRAGGAERSLRLLRVEVELHLLLRVGRLRVELVDVLPGDRDERRVGVASTVASATPGSEPSPCSRSRS